MNKLKVISIISLALFFFSSCAKEIKTNPEAPAEYKALLDEYQSHSVITAYGFNSTSAELNFSSGKSITFKNSVLRIDDCTADGAKPKIVAVDADGEWMVDGNKTGVYKDASASDFYAYPVYLCLTKDYLHIYASNAYVLNIAVELKPIIDPVEPVDPVDPVEPDPEFKGAIPVLYLTTEGAKPIVSKEEYLTGTFKLSNPDHCYSDDDNIELPMRIRGRGNSTWGMPKKPYKIKFDSKVSLFGMPKDKEWCLLANYADKSLIRNITAMQISRICGFAWTPGMVSVEVYLNGKYQGIYTLAEHKKVSNDRVNIDLAAGDMYFELESNQDEIVCWWTDHGQPVMFSDPAEPTAEQEQYAKKFFYDMESALWAKADYSKYIDEKSFIDYYILQEITKNIDGNLRKSTFMTLERSKNKPLEMYHVWDFDLTMGNCDYYDNNGLNTGYGNTPKGWWIKDRNSWGPNHGWYYRLFMYPDFGKKVRARWEELYPELQKVPEFIDAQAKLLNDAQTRNFRTWNILNIYVWPNYKIPGSYQGEVDWLKEFYTTRIEWMNSHKNEW